MPLFPHLSPRRVDLLLLSCLVLAGALGSPPQRLWAMDAPEGTPLSRSLRQAETPIYALPGTLRRAEGQPFATYFIDRNGIFYALVGETVAVEEDIITLRDQGAGVKVWGTLFSEGRLTTQAEIVASAIEPSNEPPAATPNAATVVVELGRINVRTQPDANAPPAGQLEPGSRCPIVEQTVDTKWYRIECPNGVAGWVSYQLVTVEGDLSQVPTSGPVAPAPPPTATPSTPVFFNWRTAYYTNPDLAGEPVAVADLPAVSFDWGTGSPHPAVPPDNFSLRLERMIDFPAGNYRFIARADDGVRVFLNGEAIISDWQIGAARDLRADRYVAGSTRVVVEYFEATGNALLHFGFGELRTGEWEANYFNNRDLAGNPVWIEAEASSGTVALDRNWGIESPRPGVIAADDWSARWRGTFFIAAGTYDFYVRSDDGVRVYLDDVTIFNAWTDGLKEQSRRISAIGEGYHDLRVEFYERTGAAQVQLFWQRADAAGIQ